MELIIHGDAATVENTKPGWGWSTVETDMYRNPKAVERVRSSLAKIGLPARINLMFDDRANPSFAVVKDEEKIQLTSMMHPGMINFFVRNNSGSASRHNPLTPWIILHRMHHGFEVSGQRMMENGARKMSTGKIAIKAENEIRKVLRHSQLAGDMGECNLLSLACTMRSARVRQLFPFCLDIAAELFAQYHTTGDIKFQGLDSWQFDTHDTRWSGDISFTKEQKGKFAHFYVSKHSSVTFTAEQTAAIDEILVRYKPLLIEAIQHETELMKTIPVTM